MSRYPDRSAALALGEGLINGFKLMYSGPRQPVVTNNLISANQHPKILQEKIDNEVREGRMSGPFKNPPMQNLHISPIGIVPKADGGWRMIMHLSYPPQISINHNIDPIYTTVTYTSFDRVIETISQVGVGAVIAKCDIKSAFRLIRVYPGDFELLGLCFKGKYYFDKCLPFGCAISCKIFEMFATFLEWLVREQTNLQTVHHYLDDFIFIGNPNTDQCLSLMGTFQELCREMGVPLNNDKTVQPTTCLIFLGLEIDTVAMQIRIPQNKVKELVQLLSYWVSKKKILLSALQAIVGKLNFFGKAIPGSRAFNRRFYNAMINLDKPYYHIRINRSMKEDMRTWLSFLQEFNGVVYFPERQWTTTDTLQLFTDSAGSAGLGCGCYFHGQWIYLQWPDSWANSPILRDITFLELVPIVLALHVWGKALQKKKIIFFVDNMALVHILNKQSSKSDRVMSFLRPLILVTLHNHIQFKAQHIPGMHNLIADAISRKKWEFFRRLEPNADKDPQPLPVPFQILLSQTK